MPENCFYVPSWENHPSKSSTIQHGRHFEVVLACICCHFCQEDGPLSSALQIMDSGGMDYMKGLKEFRGSKNILSSVRKLTNQYNWNILICSASLYQIIEKHTFSKQITYFLSKIPFIIPINTYIFSSNTVTWYCDLC